MSRRTAYASIVETIEDCKAILAYINKHRLTHVRVITLSLEAYRYLLQEPQVENLHVWKLLDMEALLHQAFLDAQQAAADWVDLFPKNDNLLDVAIQSELDVYVFYHSLVAIRVAEALKPLFLYEGWVYLVPPIRHVWLSRYFPNFQKRSVHNFVFKAVSIQILEQAGVRIEHVSPFNRVKLSTLSADLVRTFLRRIAYDIGVSLRGRLLRRSTIDDALKEIDAPVDVVVSGWGIDLSRIISFAEFKRQAESSPKNRLLNLIWRPEKVEGFDPNEYLKHNFRAVVVDEEVTHGVAHGPKLSLFDLPFLKSYVVDLLLSFLRKRLTIIFTRKAFSSGLLNELFSHRSVRLTTGYIALAYRHAFLHSALLSRVFRDKDPLTYIGADNNMAAARSEHLIAKSSNVATLSIPHGYCAYGIPAYYHLADRVLVHGPAVRQLLAACGVPDDRIYFLGNSHLKRDEHPEMPEKVRIVIATRSRGGLWSNYSSQQDRYDEQLINVLGLLTQDDRFEVTIKSHPNGDYHGYYDLVAHEFSPRKVRHIPAGWKLEVFLASCDILVCLGELPSFFLSAIYANIPVIYLESTMTKTQKHLGYDYSDCCAVVRDYSEAVNIIRRLVNDDQFRTACLDKQQKGKSAYSYGTSPEKTLMEILDEIRQLEIQWDVNSSNHCVFAK